MYSSDISVTLTFVEIYFHLKFIKVNRLFLLYLKLFFLCVLDFLFYFLLYCSLTHFTWFHNILYQEDNVKIPCLKERKREWYVLKEPFTQNFTDFFGSSFKTILFKMCIFSFNERYISQQLWCLILIVKLRTWITMETNSRYGFESSDYSSKGGKTYHKCWWCHSTGFSGEMIKRMKLITRDNISLLPD